MRQEALLKHRSSGRNLWGALASKMVRASQDPYVPTVAGRMVARTSGTFSKTMHGSHLPPLVDGALTEGRGHVFHVVSGPAWNTGPARSGHSVDAGQVKGRGPLLLGVRGAMRTPRTVCHTYVAACPFVLLEQQIIKVSLAVTWSLQNVLILE